MRKYSSDEMTRNKYIRCLAYTDSARTDYDSLYYAFDDFMEVLKIDVNRVLLHDSSGCK